MLFIGKRYIAPLTLKASELSNLDDRRVGFSLNSYYVNLKYISIDRKNIIRLAAARLTKYKLTIHNVEYYIQLIGL